MLIKFTIAVLVATFLPSVDAICCYGQTHCAWEHWYGWIYGTYCFDCESCYTIGNTYCSYGSCNLFGCDCEADCIQYDPNAWCVQSEDERECHVMKRYQELIKGSAELVQNTNSSNSDSYVKRLVSLVRPKFVNDPLTYREFSAISRKLFKQTSRSTKPSRTVNLRDEFEKMDKNNNGLIELTEIDSGFRL